MNETLYLGEDGVDRPAAEHRKHLLEQLKVFGDPESAMYDEDIARRIRHRIDAFDRHTGAT